MSLAAVESYLNELRAARARPIAPCPMLPGRTPTLKQYDSWAKGPIWYVQCENDEDTGDWTIVGPFRKTPEEAIVAWNEGMRRDR